MPCEETEPIVAPAADGGIEQASQRADHIPDPPTSEMWLPPASPVALRHRVRTGLGFGAIAVLALGGAGVCMLVPKPHSTHDAADPINTPDFVAMPLRATASLSQPPSHTLGTLPASVQGIPKASPAFTRALVERLAEGPDELHVAALPQMTFAAYFNEDGTGFLFMGESADNDGALKDRLAHARPAKIVEDSLARSGIKDVVEFPADDLGGAIGCGTKSLPSAHGIVSICVWADRSTTGAVMAPRTSVGTAAIYLAELRGEVEK